MARRRDTQPSLWDRPPPPPPPAPNVEGVLVCVDTCPRESGFVCDDRGWWVCGACRRPTALWFAAVRPDRTSAGVAS